MRRINTTNKAVDLFGAGKHGWKNGVPGTSNRPTEGQAEWFNALQEELSQVVEGTGQELDAGNNAQLIAAIRYLAGRDNPYLETVIFGDGSADKSAEIAGANAVGKPIRFFGICVVGAPTTINVPIADTTAQIFSAGSAITIDNKLFVRPEWFGAGQNTLDLAVGALPASGGVVKLEARTYQTNNYAYGFGGAGKYISKPNVTLLGAKMPQFSDDMKSLVGGTVIQGMLLVWADNFEARDLGVDCGFTFINTVMGGVAATGFSDGVSLTFPNNAIKAANGLKKQARLHNVVGLCFSPSSPNHGVLIEGYEGVSTSGKVVGGMGTHGVAIKSRSVSCEKLAAYCNATDGVVIKSDAQTTARASDVQIGEVFCRDLGPGGWTPYATPTTGVGLLFQASGGSVSRVQIGKASLFGYSHSLGIQFDTNDSIENVQIGQLTTDQVGFVAPGAAIFLLAATGFLPRFHIDSAIVRNSGTGLLASFLNATGYSNQVSIGKLEVVNSSDVAVDASSAAAVNIGHLIASNCAAGVYRISGDASLQVGALSQINGTAPTYTTTSSGLAPALANSWTQVAANDPFGLDLLGGRIGLRGLVKPGTSNTICVLPKWARPATNKRFMVQGYNGAAVAAVPLIVDMAGNVVVNEVAGGTANCATWLSLSGVIYDRQA